MHSIDTTFYAQRAGERFMPVSERKYHLKRIRDWIYKNRSAIHLAMRNDLGKPAMEVDSTELFHVLDEVKVALECLDDWTAARKIDAPFTMIGTRSLIQYEARGVCLIISPWNYPFSLAIGPLVSALAAGNRVIIKPSELTPAVSALIKKFAAELFDEKFVSVFEGGPEISQHLISLPFDHILFTGSPGVGKLVMKAAAENLTSVTLELGGKSPAIVTSGARVKETAKRITVSKFINNGQTCVAPDYVVAHESIAEALVQEIISEIVERFPEQQKINSAGQRTIVNDRHFMRLSSLLEDAKSHGAIVRFGGKSNRSERLFQPTVLTAVSLKSRIMEEEIFGPILPVITYSKMEDAIKLVNAKPKPLALYIFGADEADRNAVLDQTSSGGVCINDCAIQFLNHNLPFGGINNSGQGKSHGYAGFQAFSHEKSIMKQRKGFTSVQVLYPPYTNFKRKLMERLLGLFRAS